MKETSYVVKGYGKITKYNSDKIVISENFLKQAAAAEEMHKDMVKRVMEEFPNSTMIGDSIIVSDE